MRRGAALRRKHGVSAGRERGADSRSGDFFADLQAPSEGRRVPFADASSRSGGRNAGKLAAAVALPSAVRHSDGRDAGFVIRFIVYYAGGQVVCDDRLCDRRHGRSGEHASVHLGNEHAGERFHLFAHGAFAAWRAGESGDQHALLRPVGSGRAGKRASGYDCGGRRGTRKADYLRAVHPADLPARPERAGRSGHRRGGCRRIRICRKHAIRVQ